MKVTIIKIVEIQCGSASSRLGGIAGRDQPPAAGSLQQPGRQQPRLAAAAAKGPNRVGMVRERYDDIWHDVSPCHVP